MDDRAIESGSHGDASRAGDAVELLYWEGCSSYPQALAELREALESIGHGHVRVSVGRIEDDGQAEAAGFVGSPTIRVNGVDPFPPGEEEPPGLTCRIYRRTDGRFSPTPDPQLLREQLRRLLPSAPE